MKTDKVLYYFKHELLVLVIIIITGIACNIGMVAAPWFEGQMIQCIVDIMDGDRHASDMLILVALYILTVAFVQFLRFLKRLYVRRFGNNVNREMKSTIYKNILYNVNTDTDEAGDVMTKTISDADACAEGMRKFTTEIFDTCVVMLSYLVMLLMYDWRLTIIAMLFPPCAYIMAEKLKVIVTESVARSRESSSHLTSASYERILHALTYRIYGQESHQNDIYETYLDDYEHKAIRANIWENALQPLYQVVSMIGTLIVIWFGSKNVLGTGWAVWNVAAFTTYFSCYKKLAVKSSKAAKLFNAVQKAMVSWKRIKPYLAPVRDTEDNLTILAKQDRFEDTHDIVSDNTEYEASYSSSHSTFCNESSSNNNNNNSSKNNNNYCTDDNNFTNGAISFKNSNTTYGAMSDFFKLKASHLTFSYPGQPPLFSDVSFTAKTSDIIGVTGAVACGKSTLGKILIGELPYNGTISFNGSLLPSDGSTYFTDVGYLGHQPDLLSATVEENICLGRPGDISEVLRIVCLDEEIASLPDGINTLVGNGGVRLSGGQQARLALARTLYHKKHLLVLDDPFSAVDMTTEQTIYDNLRTYASDCIIILISHRLSLFSQMDGILWMDGTDRGTSVTFADYDTLMNNEHFHALRIAQQKGDNDHDA